MRTKQRFLVALIIAILVFATSCSSTKQIPGTHSAEDETIPTSISETSIPDPIPEEAKEAEALETEITTTEEVPLIEPVIDETKQDNLIEVEEIKTKEDEEVETNPSVDESGLIMPTEDCSAEEVPGEGLMQPMPEITPEALLPKAETAVQEPSEISEAKVPVVEVVDEKLTIGVKPPVSEAKETSSSMASTAADFASALNTANPESSVEASKTPIIVYVVILIVLVIVFVLGSVLTKKKD